MKIFDEPISLPNGTNVTLRSFIAAIHDEASTKVILTMLEQLIHSAAPQSVVQLSEDVVDAVIAVLRHYNEPDLAEKLVIAEKAQRGLQPVFFVRTNVSYKWEEVTLAEYIEALRATNGASWATRVLYEPFRERPAGMAPTFTVRENTVLDELLNATADLAQGVGLTPDHGLRWLTLLERVLDQLKQGAEAARTLREFASEVYTAARCFDGTWGRGSQEDRRRVLEEKAQVLMANNGTTRDHQHTTASAATAEVRACTSCSWTGTTDRMCGSIGPLCPECGDTTELVRVVAPFAVGDVVENTKSGNSGRVLHVSVCNSTLTIEADEETRETSGEEILFFHFSDTIKK